MNNRKTATKKELEIWGRAQLEAARRTKPDWATYGASRTCKNLRGQRPIGAEI